MKPNVYKKRKITTKTKAPTKNYIKKDKLNRWAPKISLKEYKYFDNNIATVSIPTATVGANVDWLNQTTVGSWAVNRVGNKIIMKSIHIQGILTVTGAPTTPVIPNIIRMALIYDKQPSGTGTLPLAGDVFQSVNGLGATEVSVFSAVNISNRERFIILRDYKRLTPRIEYDGTTPIFELGQNGALGQGSEKSGQTYFIDDYVKLNLPVVYKVNSSQIANDYTNIETGALLLMCYSGGQSGNWVFSHSSRVVFKEENPNN